MTVNTAALKTFAPAMRRQLMEAVGRKLDLLLHSQTPDILATYASQIAELRKQEEENPDRCCWSGWPTAGSTGWAALRYLDAKGWHPFGCKVLMPATEGEIQPELLKLMRSGSLPSELKEHCNEARLNGLLNGQIPTPSQAVIPRGRCTGSWCWRSAAPITSCCRTCSKAWMTPPNCCCRTTCSPMARLPLASAARSARTGRTWRYRLALPVLHLGEEGPGDRQGGEVGRHSGRHPAFTPNWIVKYMVQNSLGRSGWPPIRFSRSRARWSTTSSPPSRPRR